MDARKILDNAGISYTIDKDNWDGGKSLKQLKSLFFKSLYGDYNMDNRTCYWCDERIDKEDEQKCYYGYYCTFSYDELVPCDLDKPCFRYIASNKVPEYIRYLLSEIEFLESTHKLP